MSERMKRMSNEQLRVVNTLYLQALEKCKESNNASDLNMGLMSEIFLGRKAEHQLAQTVLDFIMDYETAGRVSTNTYERGREIMDEFLKTLQ